MVLTTKHLEDRECHFLTHVLLSVYNSHAIGKWTLVNPFPTRGPDHAQQITACPPGFKNLKASLYKERKRFKIAIFKLNSKI